MNKYLERLPNWKEVREKFWISRWYVPAVNLSFGAIFLGWGLTQEGWWRDYFMVLGGGQLGFALIWFVTPMRIYHVSPEQRKAMSDDMALIMIEAARRAEEAYGVHFRTEQELPPPTSKMN
jgi:hypothetical protein